MNAALKIEARITRCSVSALKEMAVALFVDTREGSEYVLSAVLSALEKRMPEDEFVAFCEAM